HFLTQIPQPMHRNSEMNAILSVGLTSIHSFPNIILSSTLKHSRSLHKRLTHFHNWT
ncbi:hypothetical protein L208DRAFT_1330229, partial [Tricholoma matsutake]